MGPEESRVWFTHFTSDERTPQVELRAFQDSIFVQDRPIIESQQPRRLPLSGGEAHSAADRGSPLPTGGTCATSGSRSASADAPLG